MTFFVNPGEIFKFNGSYYKCRLVREDGVGCKRCSFDKNMHICNKFECTPLDYPKSEDVYFEEVFNVDSSQSIDELILHN